MMFDDLDLIRQYSRQYKFNIKSTDTGPDDRITAQYLAAYIQEAASLDAMTLGFGADKLDDKGIVWILIRHSIRFYDRPSWTDEIIIDTWTNGASGIYALRDFNVSSPNGKTYARASSSWILVDRDTKRPVRISALRDSGMEEFHYNVLGIEAIKIKPGNALLEQSQPVIEFKVCASDIDRNNHVNNTRYISWCTDALDAAGVDISRISGLDINYVSEALKDEIVEISCLPSDSPDNSAASVPAGGDTEKEFLITGKHGKDRKVSFYAVVRCS